MDISSLGSATAASEKTACQPGLSSALSVGGPCLRRDGEAAPHGLWCNLARIPGSQQAGSHHCDGSQQEQGATSCHWSRDDHS